MIVLGRLNRAERGGTDAREKLMFVAPATCGQVRARHSRWSIAAAPLQKGVGTRYQFRFGLRAGLSTLARLARLLLVPDLSRCRRDVRRDDGDDLPRDLLTMAGEPWECCRARSCGAASTP